MGAIVFRENQFFRVAGDGTLKPHSLKMVGFLRWTDAWKDELARVQVGLRAIRQEQIRKGKMTRRLAAERASLRAQATLLNRMRSKTRRFGPTVIGPV